WLHAVATHTFSLVAAWLWQMRPREDTRWRSVFMRHRVSILLYLLAQLTIVLIYAGLDFRFANTAMPWAVGLLQLLLNMAVTALILYNHFGKLRLLRFATALTFSIVNFVLLFDSSFNAFISAEAALAASSFTQIFTLFVFLVYAEEQSEIA
ncbi:MAG TPA: hypothetical protein PLY93_09650, partial [Turneriella sp.]|nr:hypothetical protein [Turneriella sp.]